MFEVSATSHVSPVLTTLEVAISFAGEHDGSVLPPQPATNASPMISTNIRMVASLYRKAVPSV
jgi:hypothetical protein